MPRASLIQLRRDTSVNWGVVNPVLAAGEVGFETNTDRLKIGDGTTAWNSLDYVANDSIQTINSAGSIRSKVSLVVCGGTTYDLTLPEIGITTSAKSIPGHSVWVVNNASGTVTVKAFDTTTVLVMVSGAVALFRAVAATSEWFLDFVAGSVSAPDGLDATPSGAATVGNNATITAGSGGAGTVDFPNAAKGGNVVIRGGTPGDAYSGGYPADGGDVIISGGLSNGQNAGAVRIGDDSAESSGVVIGNNSAPTMLSGFTIDIGGQEAAAVVVQLLRPEPSLGGRSDIKIKSSPSPDVPLHGGVTGGVLFLEGGDGTSGDGSYVGQPGGDVIISGGTGGPDGGYGGGLGGHVNILGGPGQGTGSVGGNVVINAGSGDGASNSGEVHVGDTYAKSMYLGNQFTEVTFRGKTFLLGSAKSLDNLTGGFDIRVQAGRDAVAATNVAGNGGSFQAYAGEGGYGSPDYMGGNGGNITLRAGQGGPDYGSGWGNGGDVFIDAGASGEADKSGVVSIGTVWAKQVDLGSANTLVTTGGTFSPASISGSVASVGATIPIQGLRNSVVTFQVVPHPSNVDNEYSVLRIQGARGHNYDHSGNIHGRGSNVIVEAGPGGDGDPAYPTYDTPAGGNLYLIGGKGGNPQPTGTPGIGGSVVIDSGEEYAPGSGLGGNIVIGGERANAITLGRSGHVVTVVGDFAIVGTFSGPGRSKWSDVGILATPTGAAQNSGFDLPEGSLLLAVIFRVDIPEVAGTTKTMNVGSLATPALWLSATNAARANGNYLPATGVDMGSGLVPFGLITAANKRVYYTAGSGDWTAFRGRLYFLTVTGP